MRVASSLFCCFLSKKEKKVKFHSKIEKKKHNTVAISLKCNVFYARYIVFILQFFVKKERKISFQRKLEQKPLITRWNFQNM